jgi:hypothetical protein
MNALRSRALARTLVGVLLAVGAVVGAIALLELSTTPWVLTGLTTFRPGFHVVGGQVRATSTLLYPTVTSMYLEVVFALGLWWLVEPPSRARGLLVRLAPGAALLLVGAGIIATFTRTGLAVMACSLAAVSALRFARTRRFDAGQRSLIGVAALLLVFVGISRTPEVWISRLSADTAEDWYGARFEVPEQLSLRTGRVYAVPITVTNEGRLTWQSEREPIFAVSYHWLAAGTSDVVHFDGARTPFANPVAPGQRVTMAATVRAPAQGGDYRLAWDVVHEGRTWLSIQGAPMARTSVVVEGDHDAGLTPVTRGQLPTAAVRLPRRTLWRAAVSMAAAHPLAGVGPDNFRLVYGDYLGLDTWDRRVHANNVYFEVLAGAGAGGLIALLWVVGAAGWYLWTRWRAAPADVATPWACLLVAWFAIASHGLVDSFLTFTSTYVVFALTAGLALSPAFDAAASSDAHRL